MRYTFIPPLIWFSGATSGVDMANVTHGAWTDVVPLSNRRRLIFASPEWVRELAERGYKRLRDKYKANDLPNDHPMTVAVCRVGRRVEEAAVEFAVRQGITSYANNAERALTYVVIDADTLDLCCLVGNRIVLSTGFLSILRGDDELAAVSGHEVAHFMARHIAEMVTETWLSRAWVALGLVFMCLMDSAFVMVLVHVVEVVVSRLMARQRENEADQIGLYIAAAACFDPHALARFFSRLRRIQLDQDKKDSALVRNAAILLRDGRLSFLFDEHPPYAERIQQLQEWTPDVLSINRWYDIRQSMHFAQGSSWWW